MVKTRSRTSASSSLLLSVPDSVLSDFALVRLPARSLGCAAMACVKLRQCAGDAILQIARSIHVRRREGESLGSVLFAIRVLKPSWAVEERAQGGGGECEVFTFGEGDDGKLGHGGEDNEPVPRRVDALVGKRVVQMAAGVYHTAVVTSDARS